MASFRYIIVNTLHKIDNNDNNNNNNNVGIQRPMKVGCKASATNFLLFGFHHNNHHHHKHQGLDPLIHSVSRVTAARANASSVSQLFSFLVVCSGMISKGFGFVA